MLKFTRLLTVFLLLTISFGIMNCSFAASDVNSIPVKAEVKGKSRVIVYYFYAKPRCANCKKIEAYTKEAVTSLNNGKIGYNAINLDKPENKHYANDYKLYTKSVILSKVKNGKEIKWKNLDGIWTKLGNENDFKSYITKEVKNFGG